MLYVFKMTVLLFLKAKFAFFRLTVVGSDLTSTALRCKYELGVGAANVELSLFAVFLQIVSNKQYIFQGTGGM